MTGIAGRRPSAAVMVPASLIGWAIIGFGIHSALRDADDSQPVALAIHVVAFDLANDAVIALAVFVAGWALGRFVPPIARGPVRLACATSAIVLAFAFPLVSRLGRRPTNSSALPLDYGRNVLVVLTVVWLVAPIVVAWRSGRVRPA